MAESKLHVRYLNDKVYFYYGDILLFTNSKSMPFIVLKKNAGGVETVDSFSDYVLDSRENVFFLTFKNGDRTIVFTIEEKENELYFTSDYEPQNGEEMCLTFYTAQGDKVYGLPSFKDVPPQYGFFKTLVRKIAGETYESIRLENKLSFFLIGKYYFNNHSITEYDLKIYDNLYLTIRDKNPSFSLLFTKGIKQILAAQAKSFGKIKKYPHGSVFLKVKEINEEKIKDFIKKYPNLYVQGIIIKRRPYEQAFLSVQKKSCDRLKLDLICSVGKQLSDQQEKRYFQNGPLSCVSEETVRSYMVVVRKYLDNNIAGIYFEGGFTSAEMTLINEEIYSVASEYPEIAVFHETLSEKTSDFGYYIIKNPRIIEKFYKLKSYYKYSGEKRFGKEEKKYTENKEFTIHIIDFE